MFCTISWRSPDRWGSEATRTVESHFPAIGRLAVQVPERPGTHTLEVTATDRVGHRVVFKHPILVVPPPPRIRLLTLDEPTMLRGGERVALRWESRFTGRRGFGGDVEGALSRDGGDSWETVARERERTGTWWWEVPREDFEHGRIRVSLRSQGGDVTAALSAPFTVSTRVPLVSIVRIEEAEARSGPDSRD